MLKRFGMLALLVALFATVGCKNTVEGVGKDTEKAGEKIQDSTK